MLREAPTHASHLAVSEVASLVGVSVRTLHHYDEIGLVVPIARSRSGHRRYAAADVARLREIRTWRQLGVPLRRIPALLDARGAERRAVLEEQRALIGARIEELRRLAEALDQTTSEPDSTTGRRHAALTEAVTRSNVEEPAGDLAVPFAASADPTAQVAVAASEAWRIHVGRWFHDLNPDMQRALGEMYVEDPRFMAHYEGPEDERAGFAVWMRTAFAANADALRNEP